MLWILGVCNMSLGMLCAPGNIHNTKGYECRMCQGITQFVLEDMNGAQGRLREKIAAVLLYCLHSISPAFNFSFLVLNFALFSLEENN
jgi:hypothetical protein